MAELLPCPFCGGKAKAISFIDHSTVMPACKILCCDCGANSVVFVAEDHSFAYQEQAIEAWNKRTESEDKFDGD